MSSIAYAGLWVFIFSLPWEKVLALPGLAIVARTLGATAALLTVISVVTSGSFRRLHAAHVLAVLFWTWAALELFLFHFGDRPPYKFWTFGQLILVMWMIWELARTEQRVQGLFLAFVCGAYVAAFDTVMLFRREAETLRRFSAGELDGNDLAMVLALSLPMAWYLGMVARRPLIRWACRAYLPVVILSVGLTGSRGGMLATTVALLFIPLSMTRLSPGRIITAGVMLITAGCLAVAFVPETLIERLGTTSSEVEAGRFGGRGKLWRAGLEIVPENPIFGHGIGAYKTAITPKLGSMAQVAHNSYISVLVEEGIVGLVLYLGMFAAVFFSILKLPRLERRFAVVLMATLGVAMFPLTWEDRRPAWFVLSALLALSQAHGVGQTAAARAAMPRTTGIRARRWSPRPVGLAEHGGDPEPEGLRP
jgi:O-antigen ligase